MSWSHWLDFDAIAAAPRVTRPTLLVHSEQAALPDGARRFYAALGGPRQEHWMEGTHFDFYDGDGQVGAAVELAAAHFARHAS